MSKIIRNIISTPLLLDHGYRIKEKSKCYSICPSNEFYGYGYVDNGLILLFTIRNEYFCDRIIYDENIFIVHKSIYNEKLNSS